ncbi:AIM24 family protein [Halobacterium zhouii]|uniref:AIM24 family protein n=1 Tax=Halobacterium zhouii TaxID=2902624 RepID=UPI001E47C7FB|nr:AIM24 family protein [Halobacterium zhouii]
MDATAEPGASGTLVLDLDAGESVLAATDSLVDHTGGVRVRRPREDALRSVANATSERTPVRVVADENATVRLAPPFHGEVVACSVDHEPVATARTAFLAATDGVRVGADRVGDGPARGDGLFLTTGAGDGTLYLAGRGRVDAITLEAGDERVVTAAHVVAFEERADVTVERAGAQEEATPTCRIQGPATVWVGTRPAVGGRPR